MHVQALYVHDDQSRLISINDWNGGLVPRFFLGRTDQGSIWRFRSDIPHEICEELTTLCKTEPYRLSGPPIHEHEYQRILSRLGPVDHLWNGPAYWFSQTPTVVNTTTAIKAHNAFLLEQGLKDWIPDIPHQQPMSAIIVDDKAVAICASVRITDAAHEAGVETRVSHQKQGFAVSVVSAWAHAVQEMGALPLYSTSNENMASQKVAARLGLSKFGADFRIN
jgi:RimJ/RimL family protein N-acetyltransferase